MTFLKFVAFKQAQHARVMTRAKQYRGRGDVHAEYLAQAAMIRNVLAADMRAANKAESL